MMPEHIMNLVEHVDGYATPNMVYTQSLAIQSYDIHWEKTSWILSGLRLMAVKCI